MAIIKNASKQVSPKGFTIVEMLAVVTVIGILAGVVIVGYGAWRNAIVGDAIKSDLNGLSAAMENARNFSNGYPATIPATFQPSSGVTLTLQTGNTYDWYCVSGASSQGNELYYLDSVTKGDPIAGSCPSAQQNLIKNPVPSNAANYVSSGASTIAVTFPTSASGQTFVRATRANTSAGALYVERASGGVATAQAGDVYTIVYTISASADTTLTSQVGYGTGTSVIGSLDQPLTLVASVPQTVRRTVTIPSGYNGQPIFLKILWAANVGAVGNYFDVSNVMWTQGSYAGDYKDGESAFWSWSGAANASVSRGRPS